ncbi:phage tail protein [Actinoplanes sp. NPDC049596]|uniref:phage tail protein n=1 Tax=unclassified Actinoplanes TaxID=2626549 RepID=UPI00343CAA03
MSRPAGPPFLRLGPRTGWHAAGAGLGAGIAAESDGTLVLGVPGRPAIPVAEPFGTFGGRTMPRGLAVDGDDGRMFLADPDGHAVLVWPIGPPGGFTPLWPARPSPSADPYALAEPSDVALSPAGDLVIADPGAGRVLVLAYPTAQLRHVIELPRWRPTALAFDHADRAYVADPGLGTVHRFSRGWRRDPAFPHRSAVFAAPGHVAAVRHPAGREAPVVVVLDGAEVTGLNRRGLRVAVPEVPELEPAPLRRAEDGALLFDDDARPWADPLVIDGLDLLRDGRHAATGRPLLAVPRRAPRPQAGVFTTAELDGERPGFAWDRVVLRAGVPAGTRLVVSTRTDDSRLEPERLDGPGWSVPLTIGPAETPEVLVQSPPGRYLWLRVELFGDGRATPRVERIDVSGPRAGSVRHLPLPYHQDPDSRHFLDRFLAYFDTVFAEITTEHREIAALLDPYAAPAGPALDWLGGWFGLDFLAEWPPALRRRMITEAMAYARERGTVRGLRRVLQWHTGLADPLPRVIEHFRVPPGPVLPYIGGEPLDATPRAHGCTVVLPDRVAPDTAARARLERLIAAHMPGHVRWRLRLVPAGVVVGRQSSVGVDTLVGSPTSGALGEAALGRDLTTGRGPRAAVVPGRSLSTGRRLP